MEFEIRMGTLPKTIKREIGGPLKKPRMELKRDIIKAARRTTVGRALWSKSTREPGTPRLVVGQIGFRFSRSQGGWIFGSRLKGMAALIEMGAKTQEHRIRPWQGSHLVFEGTHGLVRTKLVRHPGARLKKDQILQKALDRKWPEVRSTVDRTLERTFRKVLS